MINNEELPIGFTMELAMHSDILNYFSKLTEYEKNSVIAGARNVNSKQEMREYVESIYERNI